MVSEIKPNLLKTAFHICRYITVFTFYCAYSLLVIVVILMLIWYFFNLLNLTKVEGEYFGKIKDKK